MLYFRLFQENRAGAKSVLFFKAKHFTLFERLDLKNIENKIAHTAVFCGLPFFNVLL